MILVVDNYDSFTFNIVQYLGELGANVCVHRNDEIELSEIAALRPQGIVLSPGPGRPEEAGITLQVIERFQGVCPILGVCLGHQAIGHYYGGTITKAKKIMHGKISAIYHQNSGVFKDIKSGFDATRYHSLVILYEELPSCLDVTSWTVKEDGLMEEIMGVRHKQHRVEGVQFHPESISSEFGHQLFGNFLSYCNGVHSESDLRITMVA